MQKKRNIKDLIDDLLDKDGLKTEVTVRLTNQTLTKIILALLASGATLIIITNMTKNSVPNNQLTKLQAEISTIKSILKKQLK